MDLNLVQKCGGEYKEFTLTDRGIDIVSRKGREKLQYTINYEDIGQEMVRKTKLKEKKSLYGLIMFFVVGISFAVIEFTHKPIRQSGIILVLLFLLYLVFATIKYSKENDKHYTYLTGGRKNLELFSNIPTEAAVNDFIKELESRKKRTILTRNFDFLSIKN